ncbi:MAG: Na+/H+ antiporter subunit G, partial [Rubrivivax sp.]
PRWRWRASWCAATCWNEGAAMNLDLPFWAEALIASMLVIGALFVLVGAIGLVRFPDFYMRLHAPTKASTLGVGALLLASMLSAWMRGEGVVAEILIALFVFLTAPVSANLLAQAAMHRRVAAKAAPPPELL